MVDLSIHHFARMFKQTIGVAPYRYVLARRIERAKKMLRTGTASLEISLSAGFCSQSHFARTLSPDGGCDTSRIPRTPSQKQSQSLSPQKKECGTMGPNVIRYFCILTLLPSPSMLGWKQKSASPTVFEVSPTGRWKTVDDATGKVKSLVVIWEENGRLYGKIDQLVNPDPQDPDPRCIRCEGALQGRPLAGLRILWDFRKDGEQWSGGSVLDPDNGKVYKCYLALEDGAKKLKVRGFIGV